MRLISFDVFDTLLTRSCANPPDVFVLVGTKLDQAGRGGLEPLAFAAARCRAERHAWHLQQPPREPSLAEIYSVLATELRWDEGARDSAMGLEIAVETEGIRPVPAMRAEVERARTLGRVIFISDMYLPAAVIRGWLELGGFWREGDSLWVSQEAGASKGTSRLYDKIRTELGVDFAHWTHHGDNPEGDDAQPRRLGLGVEPRPAARLNAREQKLRGSEPIAPAWRSLVAGAARLARLDQPATDPSPRKDTLWATGTDVGGPLFFAFVDWCLAEAERRGLEDLYFIARAGQIFLRIAQTIQIARPRQIRLHYLQVSRFALSGPATDSEAELRQLAAPSRVFHSARQAFAHLGLRVEEPDSAPDWLPRDEWERNLQPGERDRLADWLLSPERRPVVQAALADRVRQARTYLSEQGVQPGSRYGLVDTGWRGTIQTRIARLVYGNDGAAACTGFYLGVNPAGKVTCAGSMLGYTNIFAPLPLRHEGAVCDLLELMAQADHGPVLGFVPDTTGRMVPHFGPLALHLRQDVGYFQEAVMAFVLRALTAESQSTGGSPAELARAVVAGFAAFHRQPTRDEVLVFGRMPHSDQMLEKNHSVLCPALDLAAVSHRMLRPRHQPTAWWPDGQAQLNHAALLKTYLILKRSQWLLQRALRREHP